MKPMDKLGKTYEEVSSLKKKFLFAIFLLTYLSVFVVFFGLC